MRIMTDKLILTIYCILTVLFIPFDRSFIVALLLSVSVAASCFFFDSKKFNLAAALLVSAAAWLYPAFYLFMPLLLYDVWKYRLFIPLGLYLLGFIINFSADPAALLFYLLLGCLISYVLQERTSSYITLHTLFKKTRDDQQEHHLSLKEKNQSLLEKQDYEIYTATLKERNRIAREIHDNVGHLISRSILMVGALKSMNKDEALQPPLASLEDTLAFAMTSIRESVHDLHDESVNLKEVITGLVNDFDFCSISLEYDMSYEIPRELKYSFISITKEALSNIITHSNATDVLIRMREHPGLFQLLIEDNGTDASIAKESGIGLLNMEERIKALGGNIRIHTKQGFCIFITVPKKTVS